MIRLNIVAHGTRFACQRCTKCCSLDVMLSRRELRELQPNVDLAWSTTKKKRVASMFVCCLLEGQTCTIYPKKPLLCSVYPFFAVPSEQLALLGEELPADAITINGEKGVRYCFIYDDGCPGVGKGEVVNVDNVLELTLKHLDEMDDKSKD